MTTAPCRLGVNIDHVATVRNARGGRAPDPVRAALLAIEAGCDGITAHLREDRRHIRGADIVALKRLITKPLNLEMAATAAMTAIALETRPHAACLVPEKREERTTEGGLDVVGQREALRPIVASLREAGIRVSLFIEPSLAAIATAADLGAPVVELHTGRWCEAVEEGHGDVAEAEFQRIVKASAEAARRGIECHAGHGLNEQTAETIAGIPHIVELNIGHYIVGEALFVGFDKAVGAMRAAIKRGRGTTEDVP